MRHARPRAQATNLRTTAKPAWICSLVCTLLGALNTPAVAEPANHTERPRRTEKAIHVEKPIHIGNHVRKLAGTLEPERHRDDRPFHTWVRRAEAAYGVSADLIHAIIKVESHYNPKAVSDAGAKGLMQLMPLTASRCGVRNVFDPVQNIFGGALYLHRLAQHFSGDLVLTLAAYHAGPGAVWEARGVPTSLRTRAYVRAVIAEYAREIARYDKPTTVATRERENDGGPGQLSRRER